jgi:hypothetical protein
MSGGALGASGGEIISITCISPTHLGTSGCNLSGRLSGGRFLTVLLLPHPLWHEVAGSLPTDDDRLTARSLLQSRLPPPSAVRMDNKQFEIEKTPRACRLKPAVVKPWTLYGGKAIDNCIIEYQDLADNSRKR